jgi:hypothetical protein
MRNPTGFGVARKLVESACDAEKEWRFRPAGILSRLPSALFRLCFE